MVGENILDIVRTKQKKFNFLGYWPWVIGVLISLAAINYLWYLAQANFSVDRSNLVFDDVKRGDFSVSVRGTGVLVPDNIQWLSASVEARVERIIVKPGKLVKKGDLIAQLSNPRLVQLLEETKWELEARTAESKANQVEQESGLLDQKSTMLNAKLNYESSKLRQDAQELLYRQQSGVVSKIDYEKTLLETIQLKQRLDIQKERLRKMQENLIVQNNARKARLNKMKKTLERAQQQVNGLMIVAGIDGVVQEVPVEVGQRIPMGGNIAKLAQQDSLIAELQVAELQINDVMIGQKVLIDTRNNKVTGKVIRVDPAVIKGNVQVDVEFTGTLPTDARPDLAVEGEIKVTEISDTLFINRPLFAQSQSTSNIYKLSENGDFAQQTSVQLGKGSIEKIQIISGLKLGERVIISDPSNWDTYQKIRLN